ncbi:MAG: hypothetical protein ACLSAF_01205 [Intestinimonas sp.]
MNYYNRSTRDMAQGRDPSQNLILVYKRKEPHPSPATAGRMGSGRTTERMRPAREGGAKDAKSVRDDKKEKAMSEAYQVTPSVGVNIRSGPGTEPIPRSALTRRALW